MARSLIAVVGSLDAARKYDPPLRDLELARHACEQIGRELAIQGCDIVVYSSEAGFVEADIVRGYVASGQAQPGSIKVRSPLGAPARLVAAISEQGGRRAAKADEKRRLEQRQSRRMALSLSIAGVLLCVGLGAIPLIYAAAQLAATPNILDGAGARRLLFFVLPLGFIAGLTFDAVYAKLRAVDVTPTDILKQP